MGRADAVPWRLPVLGVLTVVLLLPGAAGLTAARTLGSTTAVAEAPGSGLLDAQGPPSDTPQVGVVSPLQDVTLEIGLASADPSGLATFDAELQDPSSPLYHHYLTPSEYQTVFGPSALARAAVQSFLVDHDASSISWTPGSLTVNAQVPEGQVAAAFGSSLGWYRSASGGTFYAPTGATQFPSALAGDVTGIDGLTNQENRGLVLSLTSHDLLHSSLPSSPPTSSSSKGPAEFDDVSGGGQIFWGTDFDGAFDALNMITNGHNGAGYSVATILWSGYNATESVALPPYDPTAVNDYFSATFPNTWSIPTPTPEAVTVGGMVPPAPGTSTLGDDVGGQLENSLDLEMVGSTAPGASLYIFYFSGEALNTNDLSPLYADFDQALSEALSFSYTNPLAAVSNSYGLPDENDTVWDGLEETAEATGVSLLASSGDGGDAPENVTGRPQGQWPSWPATAAFQDWGITAVGGTQISVTGSPCGPAWGGVASGSLPQMCYGANTISGLATDDVWYENATDEQTAGSEGGISAIFNEPQWQADSAAQSAIELAAPKEGLHYARGVPDLSSVAYGVIIYITSSPQLEGAEVAGTSVASPVMAGFVADIDGQLGHREGYLDPPVYSIGSYFLTQEPTSPADPFGGAHDITDVNDRNWVFNASTGWSPTTGWGCPDVALLAAALGSSTEDSFVYNPNGVAGQAGPLPTPGGGGSSGPSNWMIFLVAAALIAILFIALIAVGLHRRSQARAPGAALPPPGYQPPVAPYGYGAPASPPAPAYGGYPAQGYAAPPPVTYRANPASPYGTPPGYAPYGTVAAAPSAYLCRYCHQARPYNYLPCPRCGGPG